MNLPDGQITDFFLMLSVPGSGRSPGSPERGDHTGQVDRVQPGEGGGQVVVTSRKLTHPPHGS